MNRFLPPSIAAVMLAFIGMAPLVFLDACTPTPQQAKTDADLITLGVQLFGPVLAAQVPSQAQTVTDATAAIVAADAALGGVLNTSSPTLTVSTIVHDVQLLAPIAIKYLPAGSTEAMAANAALALLPAVEAAAGMAGAGPTMPVAMSPDAARMVLRGVR